MEPINILQLKLEMGSSSWIYSNSRNDLLASSKSKQFINSGAGR